MIIAIDGRAGAGKTTLALELAARLRSHHKVSLFHLEEIYPGCDGLAAGIERYVSTVLTPLSQGERATWISWDWESHRNGDSRVTLPAEVVIVEGVGAAAAEARPLLSAVIWVDSPDEVRRERALDRYGTSDLYWTQWAAQEETWLAGDDVPHHADIRTQNRTGGSATADVLQLLPYLPALAPALAPLSSDGHGLRLRAERLDFQPDVPSLFEALYGSSANAVWLDSSIALTGKFPAMERSRFSILADDAGAYGQAITHRSGESRITAGCATANVRGPFFHWLETVWGRRAVPAPEGYPCDFTLGWLGCLGYELKRETGGADVSAQTPDAALIFAGRAVVVDHAEANVWLLVLEHHDADKWVATARAAVYAASSAGRDTHEAGDSAGVAHPTNLLFSSRDTELEYKGKVAAAQHEIAEGNSYEVCMTTTLTARLPASSVDAWRIYLALRRQNPAPFGSYLRFGSLTVASTSPERFLKIEPDGGMRAEPIKGTRSRAADPAQDARLRHELENSPKDRAENIMIVDLMRNDLSHFAEPGSVIVSRLCEIESYATVHQMVSTIDARLPPGSPRAEAVAACFPAGSMTGAPKISSMAILDQLEGAPRGLYSGAIGYFSLNGATDLAVAIRTLVITAEVEDATGEATAELTLGVGGAITSDSLPDEEYDEIRVKAFGVLSSLGTKFPES